MFFHVVRILLMASGNFINSTVKKPFSPFIPALPDGAFWLFHVNSMGEVIRVEANTRRGLSG